MNNHGYLPAEGHMQSYSTVKARDGVPRIPLEGSLDLTYRCNNNCRHCWLRLPPRARKGSDELSSEEICRVVDEARAMGCQSWAISGGEPMARPDFVEIFDYISRKSRSYALNTNGTLITPEIADLMKRKGRKMISLYGASDRVHDHITRRPGSFQEVLRGFSHLNDAGAHFTVQLVPLKDNFSEFPAMVELAKSLSSSWRIGASWLYLSADRQQKKNADILAQRLPPDEVVRLDPPEASYLSRNSVENDCSPACGDDDLFTGCIHRRMDFHIDPYGGMSFCAFIKDPALRYNLRSGSFPAAWEEFIPSLAGRIRGGHEYREQCGSCKNRKYCHWCPVYAYLETGRYSGKIPYLCEVAGESRKFLLAWQQKHCRYFRVGGITVCIESDWDLDRIRYTDAISAFAVDGPGTDNVGIRYHFEIPDIPEEDLGTVVYAKAPWVISRRQGAWIYREIAPGAGHAGTDRLWIFNSRYTQASVYISPAYLEKDTSHRLDSLSFLTTDQIWLVPLLADRNAVMMHSSAGIFHGRGLVFAGHSGAGKSTVVKMIKEAAENSPPRKGDSIPEQACAMKILCDDRNIVQRRQDRWYVHGTWSHGSVPEVSPESAPLCAVFFLEQSHVNRLSRITDERDIWKRLLATLIRPMVTGAWWQSELDVLEKIVREVPCYRMQFDMTGQIVGVLEDLVAGSRECGERQHDR